MGHPSLWALLLEVGERGGGVRRGKERRGAVWMYVACVLKLNASFLALFSACILLPICSKSGNHVTMHIDIMYTCIIHAYAHRFSSCPYKSQVW